MAGSVTSTEVVRAGATGQKPRPGMEDAFAEPILPPPETISETACRRDAVKSDDQLSVNGALADDGASLTRVPQVEADQEEEVAAAAAKAASAAASRIAFRLRIVRPGDFEPERHFYPRCLNAQIHPSVRFFMGLSRERVVSRYTHLNPRVDPVELRRLLSYRPRFLRWAGCDLMHVVDSRSQRKCMVVIETNSCPSGQKSTPLFDDQDEYGGYRTLLQRALLSRLESPGEHPVPEGKLAVLFDKNPMEASGYAACLAEITNEEVYLVPLLDDCTADRIDHASGEPCLSLGDSTAAEPQAGATAGTSPKSQSIMHTSNARSNAFFRDGVLYVRRPKEQHLDSLLQNGGIASRHHKQVTVVAPPSSSSSTAMREQAEMDTVPSLRVASSSADRKPGTGAASDKTQPVDEDGQLELIPIRAALRYVTQRPWNRIPVQTRTIITNSVVSCLAGGRNKLVAAKAYDNANVELMACGLEIRTPLTIRDVPLNMLARWVDRLGGFAAIKVPYSNAGQGVYTITSQEEFDRFYEAESKRPNRYDKYIVQALISNHEWSSAGAGSSATGSMESYSRLYHVGTMPDKRGHIYVSDLRMMICGGPDGFVPVGLYARRARAPLAKEPHNNSWEQLGTNLSVKVGEGLFTSESERLMLMDKKDFNLLGLSLDDLIDAFVETCLAVRAIDVMAQWLCSDADGRFSLSLFRSVCGDDSLIREIMHGSPELRC
jgi:hypothetical protein